ncbi:hypothetical protein [Puniceicoccus vermicola]|uniref:DUF4381 domain-containing protein n=1 Tax=Puniceicoccus vermicola TaxID=388746 RepID=A0A7X1E7G1_9BACT|nr:hypothetical protein [Puniceicoccus vermicola]MBC2603712.1 hypothetical protein [Puniceicoccus vermicola]
MNAKRISNHIKSIGTRGDGCSVVGSLQRPTSKSSQPQSRALKQPGLGESASRKRFSGSLSFGWASALLLGPLTVASAQEGLRPIRGPIVPSFWEENGIWAIPAIVGAALLLLILTILIWKFANRKKLLTPKQRYDQEVGEMETLLTEGHAEEVPARLSRVLREYIEASTGIRAPEQTTEEFLANAAEASENRIPPEAIEELGSFLALMDEAKYARRLLSPEEMQSLFDSANHFVETNEKQEAPR